MKSFSSLFPVGLLALLPLAWRLPAAAQAPTWQSAQVVAAATATATSNSSIVTATASDAAGNVYLTGSFTNTVVLGGTTLTSLGGSDIFVAKFNPTSNQFAWVQQAGGTGGDNATALAVSGTSVYVAGSFNGSTAGFGTTTLTNAGSYDLFVAKLTDAGSTSSFAWAQRAGGTGGDYANALAVSGTSVYVAGGFDSATAGFGPATLTSGGADDLFVAKLTDAGSTSSFTWAQQAGGAGFDVANALAVNGTSIYVTGSFESSTAGFGPATLTNADTNAGSADMYMAKLKDVGNTGSFIWAQRAGDLGYDYATALAVSGTSVYVAGSFEGARTGFGPDTLASAGANDIFVAKLTDAGSRGSFTWAQLAGGVGYDAANALAVSGTSVYVTGSYEAPRANFGSGFLTNAGSNDVFVAKLTDAGSTSSFAWAQQAGGTGYDAASTLTVSGTSVYVAGEFDSSSLNFDAITILANASPNTNLGFLATLTDATLTATVPGRTLAHAVLFPNPARRTATLRLPAGAAPAPLTLTDVRGRVVRHYSAPAGPEAALDLSGLPAGLYLLRGAGPAQRLVVE